MTGEPTGRLHRAHTSADDPEMLVFSGPGPQKLSNVDHEPSVALRLDATTGDRDIVIRDDDTTLADGTPIATTNRQRLRTVG